MDDHKEDKDDKLLQVIERVPNKGMKTKFVHYYQLHHYTYSNMIKTI